MSGSNPSGIFGKFKDYLEFLTINKKLSKLLDDDLDIITAEYHTFQSALIYKTKNKKSQNDRNIE